ncbi:hypothetical protein CHL67_02875 [Prosthecochloris sp. GSB1]|nr:hypothetical protein CHL67_02875 [Prosthecochloris sp. GSB1]
MVGESGESSENNALRFRISSENGRNVNFEMSKRFREVLDAKGVSIRQRDVQPIHFARRRGFVHDESPT